ncbi:hypothetical protein PROFUN_16192 [Planoprotostelium fungivorum]|uniref:Uncharacterized protein n=1 Tax=Planoprotostelium fungivorum TaxID=1890364 RepID=A0A2P6MS08_9EUKA|nr:hypothetical protein PROFUN_16192 [Planoprotostelium fungivorum]
MNYDFVKRFPVNQKHLMTRMSNSDNNEKKSVSQQLRRCWQIMHNSVMKQQAYNKYLILIRRLMISLGSNRKGLILIQ